MPKRSKAKGDRVIGIGEKTVAFVSLGCPKNLIDSERMLGLLAADGFAITADHEHADTIVINTCGFLEASKTEAIEVIREALEHKANAVRAGREKRVVVAGCLVQRQRANLLNEVPEVDALVGVFDRENIVAAVRGAPRDASSPDMGNFHPVTKFISKHDRSRKGYFEADDSRLRLTPRHYAYLRISEGCNQGCTFCTIPSIRGRMRSKPLENILAEARELVADGVFELNLIGQDTTSYGADIDYSGPGKGLVGLLREMSAQSGAGWIRLMYAYPSCFTDDMIRAMADAERVVKYIDMPLQHINDAILHAMRRKVTRKQIETLLMKLRRSMADISIRTTLITGFPGETDAQHRELVKFVEDFGFDCLGVFEYSPEPGTPAGRLWETNRVDQGTVAERYDQLMRAQQKVVLAKNQSMIGRELSVLIDRVNRVERSAVGRHSGQAPDIDGQVLIRDIKAVPGELVQIKVDDFSGYDLLGRRIRTLRSGRSLTSSLPVIGH